MPVKFFNVARICLGCMGYWPQASPSKRTNLWAATNFIILFIGVVTELFAGFAYLRHDLQLSLETLCPASTSAVTLLKMFLILYYRNDLQLALGRMREMLDDGVLVGNKIKTIYSISHADTHKAQKCDQKLRILHVHTQLATRLTLLPALMGLLTSTAYNLKPIVVKLIFWLQGKQVVWKLPFNMAMPPLLLKAPFFPITYAFTAYTGYVTVTMFGGSDAFYFEFLSNVAALFNMLQHDVRSVFDQYEGKLLLTAEDMQQLERDLVRIIKRHNDIIDLMAYFGRRYTLITLAHFVSAAIVIGISIICLMSYSGFGVIIYVGYTLAAMSQLFVYCFGGTLVAESSVQLGITVSTCNWYICEPKLRRMVLLLLIRSQRAVSPRVPFFSPSLSTFASILQTSGSIIAMASSFQ